MKRKRKRRQDKHGKFMSNAAIARAAARSSRKRSGGKRKRARSAEGAAKSNPTKKKRGVRRSAPRRASERKRASGRGRATRKRPRKNPTKKRVDGRRKRYANGRLRPRKNRNTTRAIVKRRAAAAPAARANPTKRKTSRKRPRRARANAAAREEMTTMKRKKRSRKNPTRSRRSSRRRGRSAGESTASLAKSVAASQRAARAASKAAKAAAKAANKAESKPRKRGALRVYKAKNKSKRISRKRVLAASRRFPKKSSKRPRTFRTRTRTIHYHGPAAILTPSRTYQVNPLAGEYVLSNPLSTGETIIALLIAGASFVAVDAGTKYFFQSHAKDAKDLKGVDALPNNVLTAGPPTLWNYLTQAGITVAAGGGSMFIDGNQSPILKASAQAVMLGAGVHLAVDVFTYLVVAKVFKDSDWAQRVYPNELSATALVDAEKAKPAPAKVGTDGYHGLGHAHVIPALPRRPITHDVGPFAGAPVAGARASGRVGAAAGTIDPGDIGPDGYPRYGRPGGDPQFNPPAGCAGCTPGFKPGWYDDGGDCGCSKCGMGAPPKNAQQPKPASKGISMVDVLG